MTRIPLRPLALILEARSKGENPDAIERANIRARHEQMRDGDRRRSEIRLRALAVLFVIGFAVVAIRFGAVAHLDPSEPRSSLSGVGILAQRADIEDRRGRILATNFETDSLYAQPALMVAPEQAAAALAEIFPELDRKRLVADFTGDRKFLWIRRKLSPEQKQAVHDLGEPGLLFGPREMRLYPNGALAAHVLGGASFGREGVQAAEVVGVAGVEKRFDGRLRSPEQVDSPLVLSLDLSVQAALEHVLLGGMKLMNAKAAAAVLMDVRTGEVIAIASLPDFDPNNRPSLPAKGLAADSPLFDRAVQGVYELGSTFKIFTAGQALDLGLVTPATMIDTSGPLRMRGFEITDFRDYGARLSVRDVIVKSSNIGTARIAGMIGAKRQRAFLESLGFLEPTSLETVEAPTGRPLAPSPARWTDLSTVTISYGHGLSASPLHLAAAYATIANGGLRVRPTLLREPGRGPGERVMSQEAAEAAVALLREVVTDGTASMAEVPGYAVGGKTGTADKPRSDGRGYHDDKVIATFAGLFPADAPKYVIVVTLDEPTETSGGAPRRTAGWTAVPVAGEIVSRVAPLLGLRPEYGFVGAEAKAAKAPAG